ncbi:hypothetical protein [Caballeronia terrestris]|jgi:hypothetical protein|uniref:hypothetical protein n=1 Tax=Caballeronia terrestris TaxID=1226301 RepID=UPI000A60CFDE|nr:hypothetical protein [Caballeronia terrestris]
MNNEPMINQPMAEEQLYRLRLFGHAFAAQAANFISLSSSRRTAISSTNTDGSAT